MSVPTFMKHNQLSFHRQPVHSKRTKILPDSFLDTPADTTTRCRSPCRVDFSENPSPLYFRTGAEQAEMNTVGGMWAREDEEWDCVAEARLEKDVAPIAKKTKLQAELHNKSYMEQTRLLILAKIDKDERRDTGFGPTSPHCDEWNKGYGNVFNRQLREGRTWKKPLTWGV
jgi:hypothetical protein